MPLTEESNMSGLPNALNKVYYLDVSGTRLPAEAVLQKVIQTYILNEPDLDDPDIAIAGMVCNLLIQEGASAELEAILMLNEELFTVLMGLVFAGLKAKNTEFINKLELKILREEDENCDESNIEESRADIDNSDNRGN